MNSQDFLHFQSLSPSSLSSDEVHVWCAALNQESQNFRVLGSLLAPDELARADNYYFEKDRKCFIARRGLLRVVLSTYLGIEPARLQFSYGPCGKPGLKTVSYGEIHQFNLSHSNGLAMYAVSKRHRVGIDVESIHTIPEANQIAEQFFSPLEKDFIRSLPAEKRLEAFFNFWTCKEAYLKGIGDGLSIPLKQVEVSFNQGEEARLLTLHENQRKATDWNLNMIKNIQGYTAAIAVEGSNCKISLRYL